jgi:hypothetical protein
MKPNGLESLRAIQVAITEALAPEITSLFAQEAAQAVSMMAESLAAEWDTAVDDLTRDNAELRRILGNAVDALREPAGSNDTAAAIVKEIEGALALPGAATLTLSALTEENDSLLSALASLLEYVEDIQGQPDAKVMDAVRTEAYRHLKVLAVRGWSFFDVSGFRERMARARSGMSE